MKKICVVVGSIEEWNFLYSKIIKLQENSNIEFKLVVTGKLLSPDFDLKYKEIEKEFKIDKKIEMYPKLDTTLSNSNSLSLAIMGFANIFEDLKPDYIVVCGNSYSIFGACITSSIYKIPILNIFSKILIDEKIPNSILETIVNISEINFIENAESKSILENYNKNLNFRTLDKFNIF